MECIFGAEDMMTSREKGVSSKGEYVSRGSQWLKEQNLKEYCSYFLKLYCCVLCLELFFTVNISLPLNGLECFFPQEYARVPFFHPKRSNESYSSNHSDKCFYLKIPEDCNRIFSYM